MKKKPRFSEYLLGISGFALIFLCSNFGTALGFALILIGTELVRLDNK